jgi:hypothetical protein
MVVGVSEQKRGGFLRQAVPQVLEEAGQEGAVEVAEVFGVGKEFKFRSHRIFGSRGALCFGSKASLRQA